MKDIAEGSLDEQPIALRDRVREGDETDPERPELDAPASLDNVEPHLAGEPLLLELAGDEAGGEWRREQRDLQFLGEIGQRPDMVLMTVGQDDPREPLLLVLDELEVREDQLDARIVGVGKSQAEIDHDPLASATVEIDVHADLARATERDKQQFFAWGHCDARAAVSYNRLKPRIVRSGSIASKTSVCLSNKVASPPVATTVTGRSSSRLMRSARPSIIATQPQ